MPSCELCGKEGNLITAEIDSAELKVCINCAKFGKIKRNISSSRYMPKHVQKEISKAEPQIVSNYSKILKAEREKRNINQEDFAKLIQERESLVQKWESNLLKPNLETAQKLEKILKIKLLENSSGLEKEENKEKVFRPNAIPTLGDFIKVRKRNLK